MTTVVSLSIMSSDVTLEAFSVGSRGLYSFAETISLNLCAT